MKREPKRMILILSCTVFFSLGGITASMGPNLAGLANNTGTTLEMVGSVYTGIFLGALVAQLAAGFVMDHIGNRSVLLAGCLLLAVGTVFITFSRWITLLFLFSLIAGLGHGAVDLAGNVWIARLYKEKSVSALNLLNFFFGLGAFAGPAFASLVLGWWNTAAPALWMGATILVLVMPGFLWISKNPVQNNAEKPEISQPGLSVRKLYRSPILWVLGSIVLFYVGAENGVGGWINIYMERSVAMAAKDAAMVTSVFWLALTGGRMFSVALGLRVSSQKLLIGHFLGALCGSILLVLGVGHKELSILAVGIIGFCFGPTYPTMMAIISHIFPEHTGKAVGVAALMGSVGGMLIPFFQGIVLEGIGPQASALMTGLFSAIMLGIAASGFIIQNSWKETSSVRLEE